MLCRICGEYFYIRRGLLDLFQTKEEYICNKCYKKYPIHLSYEGVQLDKYTCVILSMFDKKYKIDYNLFIKEYTKIFKANQNRKGYQLLFMNHMDLDDSSLEVLDAISKLFESNLIILCLSVRK
jgi:hypothetical protein